MAVTEFGPMVVKPGLDVMDESTPEGKIVHSAWKGVTSEKTGPFRVYWGMEVESPENLWSFFDFESVEEHKKFAKEHGIHHVKDFDKVFERSVFQKHLGDETFPPTAFKSPVTEIMLAYFPSGISSEAKAAATERIAQFKENGLNKCADVQAANFGWAVEHDFAVPGEEGKTATALSLLIGWPSIDAHMRFRETDAFKESIGLIRGMEGLLRVTMCHVKCKTIENEKRKAE
ncbi:hypothetical protein N0V93_002611 [Gnomoniopsis smithogilvyi]|uniref:ABM domain-containing protein n=1 Tax=Gnomoniopsis smithogilvyi TaxID=1191159 RepID=A0A9W9CYC9_9PEZI|nr:hypothetical protein N0V93_002611 [Gnomoniopsis smithogilvyi]